MSEVKSLLCPPLRFIIFPQIILLALVLFSVGVSQAEGGLESSFTNPPAMAHPRTWWHWISGNVSSEGISADLKAMKQIGLGGCQIFTVDQTSERGPVKFMSPEWRGFMKQALGEADKLGLEVSIEGCDGWSETGGPWIKPEQGMQHVVWTEKNVNGGAEVSLDLPEPPATRGFYKDIALLAFPTLMGDEMLRPTELKCSIASVDGSKLIDGNPGTGIEFRIPSLSLFDYSAKPVEFELVYDKPVNARSLWITGEAKLENVAGELEASADGVTYTKIGPINLGGISAFPAVTGTHFRLKFPKVKPDSHRLSEIALSGGVRVDQFPARIGMQQMALCTPFTDTALSEGDAIDPAKIVDLTGKTEWNAPPGRWTLIRLGHTGTGETTHPSTTPGLECDKLSSNAMRYHFEQMFGPIMADSPAQVGRALSYITLDSWECGFANWTPLMPQEFSKRRGYDIKSWLPVFTGRMVKDAETSQRFLWDLRRTIADLLAENHYGVAQEFAHEHNMGVYAEAPGNGMPTVADNLACKGRTDIPMGEFWVEGWAQDDSKEAASAAHIYGKPIAAAESFTSNAKAASWTNDPYGLKRLGDQMFCLGVNRFVFHRYAHQPWNDRLPGMCMGPWGINFERTNTWWKQGSAWIDYLSRCQYLLQQGRFAADLLYFYGEGAPVGYNHGKLRPAVPVGFDFDVCNAEVLLNLMESKEGRVTTQSGMSYRVLVLPQEDRLTLPVLKKIAKLVHNGAVVYGPKPLHSPSLSGYPGADQELSKLAEEVWGNCDGKNVTEHAYGAGKVVWGAPLEKVLGVPPDFTASKDGFLFIHRKKAEEGEKDTDIYFVSNQQKQACISDCAFRVTDKVPELWHPDTGKREIVALYTLKDGVTTLPIHFDPFGSVFVIFRENQIPAPHPVSVVFTGDGKNNGASPEIVLRAGSGNQSVMNASQNGNYTVTLSDGSAKKVAVSGLSDPLAIGGSWNLEFPPVMEGKGESVQAIFDKLISWSDSANDAIKYFSGAATYTKTFDLPGEYLAKNRRLMLDLGSVNNIAEVNLNDKPLGILWKEPFQVDATAALKEGENRLTIKVTNLWPNRLIGDQKLAEKDRVTWASVSPYKATDPLLPSGLFGPVKIIPAQETEF